METQALAWEKTFCLCSPSGEYHLVGRVSVPAMDEDLVVYDIVP